MMGRPNNPESYHIIPFIPHGTVGAEIGVWMGNSSMRFLKETKPKHLHLVDPWSKEPYKYQLVSEHESYEDYLKKYAKVTGGSTEEDFDRFYNQVHSDVVNKFSQFDNVTIHRQWSTDFFNTFGDKLDWIYIDGDHSFEGCFADLENCLKVMKPDGIIFGDDYAWKNNKGKPGVTKAVDQFTRQYDFEKQQIGNREYSIQLKG